MSNTKKSQLWKSNRRHCLLSEIKNVEIKGTPPWSISKSKWGWPAEVRKQSGRWDPEIRHWDRTEASVGPGTILINSVTLRKLHKVWATVVACLWAAITVLYAQGNGEALFHRKSILATSTPLLRRCADVLLPPSLNRVSNREPHWMCVP